MADENTNRRRLIIVSGLSGAGKSLVLNSLEDQGYYCIDNLPVPLLGNLTRLLTAENSSFPLLVAIGIDARNPAQDLSELPAAISRLRRQGVQTELVFMRANKDILTSRFSETRRRHPLSTTGISLSDALDTEEEILESVSDSADLHMDTSETTVHELRAIVKDRLANRPARTLSIQFMSFGYKHGIPVEADYVFDIRCLPNPHWEKQLRPFSGKDQCVIDFLESYPVVSEMAADISSHLNKWMPCFEAENRSYLCIATGCTGGHHRSVYMAEKLAAFFSALGKHVVVRHRDL